MMWECIRTQTVTLLTLNLIKSQIPVALSNVTEKQKNKHNLIDHGKNDVGKTHQKQWSYPISHLN